MVVATCSLSTRAYGTRQVSGCPAQSICNLYIATVNRQDVEVGTTGAILELT
jgi:hypothetical protein